MAKCVKHFCFRLSGRQVPEGDTPLCGSEAAPSNAEATRAASRALRQVRSLLRQYEHLLPTLRTALASSCVSEARLLHVRTGLIDLEDLLEGSVAANSDGRAVCEVVTCIAAEGGGAWCPRRMLLSDAGFSLQNHASSQGFFASQSERATELMPWSDVQRVSVFDPNATPSQASKTTARQSNNLFEAELELSKPPGRLRLQFGAAGPAQVLHQLWQQSSQGVSPPLPGMDVLLEELKITRGSPPCPSRSLFTASLPHGATIAKVRQMFSANGRNNPILRLHARMGSQNMVERDWEPLAGGLVKCLHFVQPLKPQPMAPEKTRVSLVYFICPSTDESKVILQKVTRALDIPYANSFRVHHEHVFTEALGETGPQVSVDLALGINWVDRCFVKQIIESSTRRETMESMQDFMECMAETMPE